MVLFLRNDQDPTLAHRLLQILVILIRVFLKVDGLAGISARDQLLSGGSYRSTNSIPTGIVEVWPVTVPLSHPPHPPDRRVCPKPIS